MTCRPEHVTAYVDGELEPDVRAEIAGHLKGCGACTEQVSYERALRWRLRHELPQPELPTGLEDRLRGRMHTRPGLRPMRVLLPLAATILVAAFLWGRASAPFLGLQLARDHGHCFDLPELPAQIFASSMEPVSAWFDEQGTTLPPLPSSVAGLEIAGARYCLLIDRKVAHLYYTHAGRRLSVFVVPEPVRIESSYRGRALGRAVRLRRLASHAIAIVADREVDADAFDRSFETLTADTHGAARLPPLVTIASN